MNNFIRLIFGLELWHWSILRLILVFSHSNCFIALPLGNLPLCYIASCWPLCWFCHVSPILKMFCIINVQCLTDCSWIPPFFKWITYIPLINRVRGLYRMSRTTFFPLQFMMSAKHEGLELKWKKRYHNLPL